MSERNGTAQAEDLAFPKLPNLPDEFWDARPVLQHIRQAGHARMCCADAVLHCLLVRMAAFRPAGLGVQTGLGVASLNSMCVLLDLSGSGKSAAVEASGELYPARSHHGVDRLGIGTGEGLAEAYMGEVKDEDMKGKKVVRRQVRGNALFYADEGEVVNAIAQRSGAVLLSTLRTAFGGGTLGQTNANHERIRRVSNYSFGLIAALQPAIARQWLTPAAIEVGTPQRFFWTVATDPSIPEDADPPEWPGELEIDLEFPSMAALTMPPQIREWMVEDRRPYARGVARRESINSHEPLCRAKAAGQFCLMEGRRHVTLEDWELATMLWQTSCGVRDGMIAYLHALAVQEQRRKRHERGVTAATMDRAVAHSRSEVERVARRIALQVVEKGHLSHTAIMRMLNSRDRKYQSAGIALAQGNGWIVEIGDLFTAGDNSSYG